MSRSDRILVAAGGAAVVLAAVAVFILLAPAGAAARRRPPTRGVGLLVGTPSAVPPATSDQPPALGRDDLRRRRGRGRRARDP